ncbi:MAG: DUF1800 family protein [Pseudomonadota bacterium]
MLRNARLQSGYRFFAVLLTLLMAACGGGSDDGTVVANPPGGGNTGGGGTGGGGGGGNTPPPSYSIIDSPDIAQRFLSTATFGGTTAEINALVGRDAAEWLAEEFAKPAVTYTDRVLPSIDRFTDQPFQARAARPVHSDLFWQAAIEGDDQLRHRALFALSQIVVAGQSVRPNHAHKHGFYMDAIYTNAFGNYKDLLTDVTYTPSMADYLTYRGSRRADANGRLPDENYAREILQLFSIGLIELNMDGSPRLVNGEQVETYDNDDIVNLSRVFTGFDFDRTQNPEWMMWSVPLAYFDNRHSPEAKNFLNVSIPANTDGPTSVSLAIDGIFAHQNVAPFVSRQLIQRFTMSAPPPEYIERVATAFENGRFEAANGRVFGTGTRGDLEATIAAVLLDQLMFEDTVDGKLREPVLRFLHVVRALEMAPVDIPAETRLRDSSDTGTSLGQHPFRPPSVFNFYRPGYIAPNTVSGQQGLTAPELQIVNGASSIGYVNFVGDYIFNRTPDGGSDAFTPNYDPLTAIADDPATLVQAVNDLLTGGRLTQSEFDDIEQAITAMPFRTTNIDNDRLKRAQLAVFLVANSGTFAVVQ